MNDPTGGATKPPRPPAPSAPDTSAASATGEARPAPPPPAAKPPLPPRPDAKPVKPPLPPRALSTPAMPAQRAASTSAPQIAVAPPVAPAPPAPPPQALDAEVDVDATLEVEATLDVEATLEVEASLDADIVDPLASTADAVEEPASSRSRRSYERFPVEVSVDFVSEHNFFTGFSLNVSEGGLFVATHVVRPVGSLLEIRLALPDSPDPLELQTEVRWVREHNADSDASPGLGLRFTKLSREEESRIQAFMKRVRDPLFYDDD